MNTNDNIPSSSSSASSHQTFRNVKAPKRERSANGFLSLQPQTQLSLASPSRNSEKLGENRRNARNEFSRPQEIVHGNWVKTSPSPSLSSLPGACRRRWISKKWRRRKCLANRNYPAGRIERDGRIICTGNNEPVELLDCYNFCKPFAKPNTTVSFLSFSHLFSPVASVCVYHILGSQVNAHKETNKENGPGNFCFPGRNAPGNSPTTTENGQSGKFLHVLW